MTNPKKYGILKGDLRYSIPIKRTNQKKNELLRSTKMKSKKRMIFLFLAFTVLPMTLFCFDVEVFINTGTGRAAISPYIYGSNQYLTDTENWATIRLGGNRMTGYNWENNASNAGND